MNIRHIDPLVDRGWFYRAQGRLVRSALLRRLALTRLWGLVFWNVDRVLLRLTRGRLSTASPVPTALLETHGARTGELRRNAVIYFHDGEMVTIVASNGGRPANPAWFHNARANPDVRFGGEPFRATVVEDESTQARLWDLADRVFPAYAPYRDTAARAGRTIPILQLTPADKATGATPTA